jgi:hypothetical protein
LPGRPCATFIVPYSGCETVVAAGIVGLAALLLHRIVV